MPTERERAEERHRARSKKARIADRSFRAVETTTDYGEWRQDPDGKGFEGVDTVAPRFKKARAERALKTAEDVGLVEDVTRAESANELPADPSQKNATTRGTFNASTKELGVRVDRDDIEEQATTTAHEVGHAVDIGEGTSPAKNLQGLGLGELEPISVGEQALDSVGPQDERSEIGEELVDTSTELRGEINESRQAYREDPVELSADFFGSAITRPRNTKAKTTRTREELSDLLEGKGKEPSKEFVERELPSGFLD